MSLAEANESTPSHIVLKLQDTKDKVKILKEKSEVPDYLLQKDRVRTAFSKATVEAKNYFFF